MNESEDIQLKAKPHKRRPELDIVRAISILGLPFVHCYEEFRGAGFLVPSVADAGSVFFGLCALGPSIFMAMLGMNIVFSSHSTPEALARRGLKTIMYFYLLNLVRFIVPSLIAGLCRNPDYFFDGLYYSLASDILFFSGLAFLFFAFVRKFRLQPVYVMVIALALLVLNMALKPAVSAGKYLNAFLGNFIYINEDSFFPFLSWIIYPAAGYVMGGFIVNLESQKDSDRFYFRLSLVCVVCLAAVFVCLRSYKLDPLLIAASPANSYINDLFTVVITLLYAGLWTGFWYLICRLVHSKKFNAAAYHVSDAILVFYVIQWVIVGWTEYLLDAAGYQGTHFITPAVFAVVSIATFIVSLVVALAYKNFSLRRKQIA